MGRFTVLISFIAILLGSSSCVSHKELISFDEEPAIPIGQVEEIMNREQLRIQPDDILHITVDSYDELAAQPFNRNSGNLNQAGANNQNLLMLYGYLVDSLGRIDFPVIGQIAIGGLTLDQARDILQQELKTYLNDGVVNVRYLNFRFTVLGEVNLPATYTTINPRITLLEGLGMAGDLTNYANRTNLLIIREQNGKRSYERINLKNKDIFSSPYFYLQQNDVIYVEPIQARVATVSDPALRWVTFGSAFLSVVTLIVSLTR